MKKLLIGLLALGSFSIFANDKIDFNCTDAQGYKYEYSDKYGQLAKYSLNGELVDLQDTLEMELSLFDTSPMTYSYDIGYYDREESFMSISFLGDRNEGTGKIFDKAVRCNR